MVDTLKNAVRLLEKHGELLEKTWLDYSKERGGMIVQI